MPLGQLSTATGSPDLGLEPEPEATERQKDDTKWHHGHDPVMEPAGKEGPIMNGLEQITHPAIRAADDLGRDGIDLILGVVMA